MKVWECSEGPLTELVGLQTEPRHLVVPTSITTTPDPLACRCLPGCHRRDGQKQSPMSQGDDLELVNRLRNLLDLVVILVLLTGLQAILAGIIAVRARCPVAALHALSLAMCDVRSASA